MTFTASFPFNSTSADAEHHRNALLAEASHSRLVRLARAARRTASSVPPESPPPPVDSSGTRVTSQQSDATREIDQNRRYAVSR